MNNSSHCPYLLLRKDIWRFGLRGLFSHQLDARVCTLSSIKRVHFYFKTLMSKNERAVQALNPKWKVTGKTVFESGLTVRHIEEDKWNIKCIAIFLLFILHFLIRGSYSSKSKLSIGFRYYTEVNNYRLKIWICYWDI